VPDADFVAGLGHRLAAQLDAPGTDRPPSRCRVVRTAGVAAASLAAGVGIDRLVRGTNAPASPAPAACGRRTVAASADLPADGVREFESDTHLGCRLQLVTPAGCAAPATTRCSH
jgi:hypothetical protein